MIDGVASAVQTGTRDRGRCQRLNARVTAFGDNVRMPDKHSLTLRQAKDLAMNVTAGVLNRPVADLTNGSPLDSDDLDLVRTELSLAGIEVGRDRIKTVGDLIERLRARPSGADHDASI